MNGRGYGGDVTEPCVHCGLCASEPDPGLGGPPDPCLGGFLPDVIHACCGHGGVSIPYVSISPGAAPGTPACTVPTVRLSGKRALDYFETVGVGPRCLGRMEA